MNLAIAHTLAMKRDLDALVASRKGKKRSQFPDFHRTRAWMVAAFTVEAARSRKETLGVFQSIMAQAYPPCKLPLSALSKDIPKDTEPTLAYVHVDGKYEEVKMALQNYGFRCDYEKNIPPLTERIVPAQDLIDQVKLYVEKIEDTYPPELFADLPRFGLIKRHAWLMKAIAMLDRNTALMNLDRSDRSNIILTTEIVDAFAFMGVYYELKRQMALSRLMKKLAREHYVILNGSAVGYELMCELCYQQNGLNTA
ncbi:hypothetical protein E4T38_04985 [Aureobasidium subglaciale]|nr:hypothetical protein E4T38_04985 [Aureobasidium subglaciale]KAI5222237.1 hypothetical protein E4T40_05023 [Aureobasidium subglaciale]KAI5226373.1 hypothetical protein E4T41_04842 [Aureobasidium subglaciale]KAI5262055.1 hypothetical protein E4T46_04735 [Aureobasidium subglaciale]